MDIADYVIVISSSLVLYSFYWIWLVHWMKVWSRDYDAQHLLRVNCFRRFEYSTIWTVHCYGNSVPNPAFSSNSLRFVPWKSPCISFINMTSLLVWCNLSLFVVSTHKVSFAEKELIWGKKTLPRFEYSTIWTVPLSDVVFEADVALKDWQATKWNFCLTSCWQMFALSNLRTISVYRFTCRRFAVD